jgi:hypothetical protein
MICLPSGQALQSIHPMVAEAGQVGRSAPAEGEIAFPIARWSPRFLNVLAFFMTTAVKA